MAHKTGQLPLLIVTPADVGRLQRELGQLNEQLLQLRLRDPGQAVKLPKTSQLLDRIVEDNGLNLLHEDDRKHLQDFLQAVRLRAPVLHMSFSTDPSPQFLEKLMVWLRREIHPLVLLTIGLQPTIGAGCVVRSRNRYFDFSLRQNFAGKRDLLISGLTAGRPAVPAPTVAIEEPVA